MNSSADLSPLISAFELNELAGHPEVKIFDVRGVWGRPSLHDEYLAGHVPGASFLDWRDEFVEKKVPINLASVADAEGAQQSFKHLGINEGDTVVLYDDRYHLFACRIWWAMSYWGFDSSKVKVLDGGWSHWKSLGLPASTESHIAISAGNFQVRYNDNALRIGLDEMIVARKDSCVIDARSESGFRGNADDPRSGHIPGSINIPYTSVLDENTGQFLDPDSIVATLNQLAPRWRQSPLVSTCGAGYAASVLTLALRLAGGNARLFDGSFSVWKQDLSRIVEQTS